MYPFENRSSQVNSRRNRFRLVELVLCRRQGIHFNRKISNREVRFDMLIVKTAVYYLKNMPSTRVYKEGNIC